MTLTISLEEPLWLDIFWKSNGTLVLLLNGCAAFVIFKFASTEMAVYKYFLMNILFWAFLLDLFLNWYFCPVALFPLPGGYCSMTCLMAWTPQWTRWPGTVTTLLILENCSVSLVISFLYRWWAIEPTVWFARTPRHMIGTCVFCHLTIIIPNASIVSLAKQPMEWQFAYIVKNYPDYSFMVNYSNWMVFPLETVGTGGLMVFILWMWAFGIVLMLGVAGFGIVQVLVALRKYQALMSQNSYKSHRQFLIALVIQAVFPFTVYFLPVAMAMMILVLGYNDIQNITYYMVAVFCMHSNVNAFVMILVTKPFRNGILQAIPYLNKRFIEVSSVQNSQNGLSRALAEEASGY